ncbi:unnamed protein product [Closterium sp. NIES-65]|nr:unnamed protein product [Closterium sp. NIES-65]
MVGPLGQYRPGFLQTEPSSSFPAAFPVEIEWGLGNELLICAPAASVAASDGAFQGRSDDRHDDVAGRGSAIVSVTWADTSSFHRQIAAGASSLYGRLQAAIAAEMAEEAEDAEIDERRERWRHVSRWSRHVSRLLSPPSSQSTLAAARASPHSLGISAADPFAAIDVEEREEWGDEPTNQSLPRGITQGELAAVWDLLRLCFLPDHTPGSADVDNDMDTRMGGSADVDSAFRGARGVGVLRLSPPFLCSLMRSDSSTLLTAACCCSSSSLNSLSDHPPPSLPTPPLFPTHVPPFPTHTPPTP